MNNESNPGGNKIYLPKDVLTAARERMSMIFDRYKDVVVSISGGKDSTVLFSLAREEAVKRGRKIHAFFLDQEAEYGCTVKLIEYMMQMKGVEPHWFQVPIRMTNATSYEDDFLFAWEPGQEWVHPRRADTCHQATGAPDRFYPFFDWFENQWGADACYLVGLRSEESLNRYRAVTKHPGLEGIPWSTKTKSGGIKFYPIYDWAFEDIWTYIGRFGVRYNRIYDYLYAKGRNIAETRVSNLIHEKAFKCLSDLQEMEPDTYNRLIKRIKGIRTAALYSREQTVFATRKRPDRFPTWRAYRDFILSTMAPEASALFSERFSGHAETEHIFRQQTRQLLLNDWENNIPVIQTDNREAIMKKWMQLL